jgi:predicted O-methyltransferase YrrM
MAPCNVTLVRRTSKKACVASVSYGCIDQHMWIGPGCRGQFICNGLSITCGVPGRILEGIPPRHFCTCTMAQRGGIFGRSASAVPYADIPAALSAPPVLVQAKLGAARFLPSGNTETMAAIFTMWNLLDAMMALAEPGYAWQTGYVRELQLRRMVELVRQPDVRVYCEIGFNGGHSSAAMLLANPQLTVHAFDLMMWKYSNVTTSLLRTTFGQRFRLHPGDSAVTVPAWTREHPRKCDMIFVDGDHSLQGAMLDMVNMRNATREGGMAVADDINSDPGSALETLRGLDQLVIPESYGPFDAPSAFNQCMRGPSFRSPVCSRWGFALFKYRSDAPRIAVLDDLQVARAGSPRTTLAYRAQGEARARAAGPGHMVGAKPLLTKQLTKH